MVTVPIGMKEEVFTSLIRIKDICVDIEKRLKRSAEQASHVKELELRIKEAEAFEADIEGKPRYEIERISYKELAKKAIVGLHFAIKASYKDVDEANKRFYDIILDCEQNNETSMANAMKKAIETLASEPANLGPEKQQVNYAYIEAFMKSDGVFMKFYKAFVNAHQKIIPIGRSPFREEELRAGSNPINADGRVVFIRALLVDFHNRVLAEKPGGGLLKSLAGGGDQVKEYQDIFDKTWKTIEEAPVWAAGFEEFKRFEQKLEDDLEKLVGTIKGNKDAYEDGKTEILELHKGLVRTHRKLEDTIAEVYEIYDKSNVPHFGKEAANTMIHIMKKMGIIDSQFHMDV